VRAHSFARKRNAAPVDGVVPRVLAWLSQMWVLVWLVAVCVTTPCCGLLTTSAQMAIADTLCVATLHDGTLCAWYEMRLALRMWSWLSPHSSCVG